MWENCRQAILAHQNTLVLRAKSLSSIFEINPTIVAAHGIGVLQGASQLTGRCSRNQSPELCKHLANPQIRKASNWHWLASLENQSYKKKTAQTVGLKQCLNSKHCFEQLEPASSCIRRSHETFCIFDTVVVSTFLRGFTCCYKVVSQFVS